MLALHFPSTLTLSPEQSTPSDCFFTFQFLQARWCPALNIILIADSHKALESFSFTAPVLASRSSGSAGGSYSASQWRGGSAAPEALGTAVQGQGDGNPAHSAVSSLSADIYHWAQTLRKFLYRLIKCSAVRAGRCCAAQRGGLHCDSVKRLNGFCFARS